MWFSPKTDSGKYTSRIRTDMITSRISAVVPRMAAKVPNTMPRATVVIGPVTFSSTVPTTLTMESVAWAGQSSVRTVDVDRTTGSGMGGSVVVGQRGWLRTTTH